MKNRFLYQIIFSFLLIMLVSCEKKEQATSGDLLMPINTGNTWTYRMSTYYKIDDVRIDTSKLEIGEKMIIYGFTCYAIVGDNPNNAKFIVGNDETGNFVCYGGISDVDTIIAPSIQFKKDANLSEEWNYTNTDMYPSDGSFDQEILPIKCIAIDTLITTPKGRYHCKGYEEFENSCDVSRRYYLAENIGIIKMEIYEDGDLYIVQELIDYNLKK